MAKFSNPLRLAVLISGTGRTLRNLAEKIREGTLPARVVLVLASTPDAAGLQYAELADAPGIIVDRRLYDSDAAYSEALTEELNRAQPGLILLAGFLHRYLFPKHYQWRIMNIHPALLPKYGGRGFYGPRVHRAVLRAGETQSGCSVHFADELYDHGPVILQKKVPVLPDDTPDSLAARVFEVECEAYPEAVRLFAENRLDVREGRVVIAPAPPHERG